MRFVQSYGTAQSYKLHKQLLSASKTFLHEMNNCNVTYLISPHINDHLSINCNTFDIVI